MISIILSGAMFDLLGPPPAHNKQEEVVVEKPAPGVPDIPPVIEKEEPVSNNEEEIVEKEEPVIIFSDAVAKIIEEIAPALEVVRYEEPELTFYEDGSACAKVEEPKESITEALNVEPVKEEKVEGVEPVEEEVAKEEEPEEKLHYYLYTADRCHYCVLQLAELEAHTTSDQITIVKNARTTKSGKSLRYYPVLEVYKGEECIYHGVGYRKWDALTKAMQQ